MLNKQAQGLSINVIVIASISIVVLIIIVLIFTGHTGKFSHTINNCEVLGGSCVEESKCKGAIMNADCGVNNVEVISGITWVTVGGQTTCCMNILD
jgi:amino acid transporter